MTTNTAFHPTRERCITLQKLKHAMSLAMETELGVLFLKSKLAFQL